MISGHEESVSMIVAEGSVWSRVTANRCYGVLPAQRGFQTPKKCLMEAAIHE